VKALQAELARVRSNSKAPSSKTRASRSSSRNRRSDSRSPSRNNVTPNLSWYHCRYGMRSQKMYAALRSPPTGKPTKRTSAGAHVCTPNNSRLFVTDRTTKRRFLVGTSSHLCVYPRRLIPQHRERVNYTSARLTVPLFTPTDGYSSTSTWDYVAICSGNDTQPLIGVDFLFHFGVLVDCRNNRLLDEITPMSSPA
jgi:hypothetical protein